MTRQICLRNFLHATPFSFKSVVLLIVLPVSLLLCRFSIIHESHCGNILCDTGCIISCTPRINIHGCISSLSAGLVGSVSSCWWSGCCRAGEIWFITLLAFYKFINNNFRKKHQLGFRRFLQVHLLTRTMKRPQQLLLEYCRSSTLFF